MSELTGTKSENPMPTSESEYSLGEKFADHFMNKIAKIRQSLSTFQCFKPTAKAVPSVHHFQHLTENNVKTIISKLSTKSSELDILPINVLKLPE